MKEDFGPSSFVEADGWFSLETGPWMGTFGAAEDEFSSLIDASTRTGIVPHAALATSSGDALATSSGDAPATSSGDIFSFGNVGAGDPPGSSGEVDPFTGCLGGFTVPGEEEAFERARSVFASLTAAEPNATWVYQGYPWFRVYSQGSSCNQTALREFIRGFTRAIPADKLLVLDLIADSPSRALWRYPDDPNIGKFTQNASLIWCALNNWGGAVASQGDLSLVMTEARAAMATPTTVGVGLTPEGIDTAPAYFSLVLDSPWTPHPTAASWHAEWGRSRCGKAGVAAAERAYELMFATVYRPDQPYLFCCSQPVYCPTATPHSTVARPTYNASLLRTALELMVDAADQCDTAAFRFDLVDVAREWLSMVPCLAAFDKVNPTGSSDDLKAQVAALLEVTADVDAMMATDKGFLLGEWLKQSRAVSDWDGSNGSLADYYEWNSRVQISTWAGGYSRREWSGMVNSYYSGRTKVWLNYTLSGGAQVPAHEIDSRFRPDSSDVVRVALQPTPPSSTAAGTYNSSSNSGSTGGLHNTNSDSSSSSNSAATARAGVGAPPAVPAGPGYHDYPGHDCNFDDLGPKDPCPHKADPDCLASLEKACNDTARCVGFNFPHGILKQACSHFIQVPDASSTVYLKAGYSPTRSSCVNGVCHANAGKDGKYAGDACGGTCPAPPVPNLGKMLAAFAAAWQNETWSEERLPSSPQGDAVAVAKAMLAKYPAH
jgi:hypothetical protein